MFVVVVIPLVGMGVVYLLRFDVCMGEPVATTGFLCGSAHRALTAAAIILLLGPVVAYFPRLVRNIMSFHGVTNESIERDRYR